jgi:site-specific recombinase XerD
MRRDWKAIRGQQSAATPMTGPSRVGSQIQRLTSTANTDRGVRKILARYCAAAGIEQSISPHKLRHFLFTWLKAQGVDDAHIQPYSGHATRQSLEIYSRMSLATAQASYDQVIDRFPG